MEKERTQPFIATREHHLLETAEDYVELVADLIQTKGQARTCDLAECLGVSHVTVVRTLQRLKKKGLLHTAPHQPIVLTKSGEELAVFAKEKHELLVTYLVSIGVPREVAAVDAEGMEHHVSRQTLAALARQLSLS